MKKIFKMLILDVDGVLTDGRKMYDLEGCVIAKTFHDHDFSSIYRFIELGVRVVFLSKDDRVNKIIAEKKNIPFIHVEPHKDKVEYLNFICQSFNVDVSEIAYVGDDVHDLQMLMSIEYPFCPSDAISEVKTVAVVLNTKSGYGVVNELYQIYMESINV